MLGNSKETKQLMPAENKKLSLVTDTKREHHRAPTGGDGGTEEIRVQVIDGKLEIRTFKRSPASFSEHDWHPTPAGVTVALPYVGCLLDAIRTAGENAELTNTAPLTGAEYAQIRKDAEASGACDAARARVHHSWAAGRSGAE
jgi:hypothetical protein